ncbi:uncharacterized protein PFL1_02361 [Pseudozyma flocculosa PF-1]|uniref:Wax synthase domain-containing protein n=1 Tax=Pseudozyma flocculosa TaxID=84751 RepID=A0A5C3F8Z0_9BASI|nr:uncharacterized protein PFL1_02361 [Pseudozyma flocculosa PF-1]EPQ30245.1 hypothetical protein PFL1_02361 [Pseudozyma flocculosa PF-1]SPO39819.1 uncharacterized protein PSFLO_05300 [Pseudozyma flocculosa]
MYLAPSWMTPELPSQWQPSFSPALPLLLGQFFWLFLLCLTLPSASTTLKLLRLASFPFIAYNALRISFDLSYTLGNPLRDASIPTVTWALLVKAIEVCLALTLNSLYDPAKAGGPCWIKPFRIPTRAEEKDAKVNSGGPVQELASGEDESALEWRPVPFPSWLSWGRIVYAVDVMCLRRPGTSLLLPNQRRALQWSQDDLNAWADYLRTEHKRPEQVPPHAHVHRFGQAETSILTAAAQFAFLGLGMSWIYLLASPASKTLCASGLVVPVSKRASSTLLRIAPWLFQRCSSPVDLPSFFEIPLVSQLLTVAIFGAGVCFSTGLPEALLLKLWRPSPSTAYLPAFDRALSSASISRLWARGWHLFHSRDFVLISRLLPFGHTRPGKLFGSFLCSAAFHAFIFCRLRNTPLAIGPTSVAHSMYDRGMYIFFLCQAGGILVERQALDLIKSTEFAKRHPRFIRMARRVWLFVVLFAPGRYFVDSVLSKGLMTKAIMDGFSPRALLLMVCGKTY